jgi:hypothetical protein
VAYDERFSTYSCGGSRGIEDILAPHSLFVPERGTVARIYDCVGRRVNAAAIIVEHQPVKRRFARLATAPQTG